MKPTCNTSKIYIYKGSSLNERNTFIITLHTLQDVTADKQQKTIKVTNNKTK